MYIKRLTNPYFAVFGNHDVRQDALSHIIYSLKNAQHGVCRTMSIHLVWKTLDFMV